MDPFQSQNPTFEPFVDATEAAKFLSLTTRTVNQMAREGRIPAHPVTGTTRKRWRFRLSELQAAFVVQSVDTASALQG